MLSDNFGFWNLQINNSAPERKLIIISSNDHKLTGKMSQETDQSLIISTKTLNNIFVDANFQLLETKMNFTFRRTCLGLKRRLWRRELIEDC